jgi:hypothetical protein
MANFDRVAKQRAANGLLTLVDDYYERIKLLKERQWHAFEQEVLFEESFCDGSAELEQFRRSKVELMKESFPHARYTSEYLEQLRAQATRWASQFSTRVLSAFPDTLTRPAQKRVSLWLSDKSGYEERHRPFVEQRQRLRAIELREHARISRSVLFAPSRIEDRLQLYLAVLGEVAPTLGFQFDKKLSRKNYPVFSKACRDWKLILVVDYVPLTKQTLSQAHSEQRDYSGASALDMSGGLLPIYATKAFGPSPGLGALSIPFDQLAPIGLEYRSFWDLYDLERNIRGYLAALSTFLPAIESHTSSALPVIHG